MRRILLTLAFLLSIPAIAQNFSPVVATQVEDSSGGLLQQGTICFQPVNAAQRPTNFMAGGGGIVHNAPVCRTVMNGVMSSLTLASSNYTSPAGIQYAITVTDDIAGTMTNLGIAYICTASGVTGCQSGTNWDLDQWTPTGVTTMPFVGPSAVAGNLNVTGSINSSQAITAPAFHGMADLAAQSQQWQTLPGGCLVAGYVPTVQDIHGNWLNCVASSYQTGGTSSGMIAQNPNSNQMITLASGAYQRIGSSASYAQFDVNGRTKAPCVNGVCSADQYDSGATGAIAATLADAGANGVLAIPKSVTDTSGFTNSNSVPVLDWRRGVAWRGHVDVFDFGVKCDGTTDDTAAFQSAVNYAGSLYGGSGGGGIELFVPSGSGFGSANNSTCRVHEITIPAHVMVVGSGAGTTQVQYNGNGGAGSYVFRTPGCSYGGFRRLTIKGGGTYVSSSQNGLAQEAIWIYDPHSGTTTIDEQCWTDDLEIIGTNGPGIFVDPTIAPTNWHIGPHIAFRGVGGYAVELSFIAASQGEACSLKDFTYDNNPAGLPAGWPSTPAVWGQGVLRVHANGQTTTACHWSIEDARLEFNVPVNTSTTQNGWTIGNGQAAFYFEHATGQDYSVTFKGITLTGGVGAGNFIHPKLTIAATGGVPTGCTVATPGTNLTSNPASWTPSDTSGSGLTITTTYNSTSQSITGCTVSGGSGFTSSSFTAAPTNTSAANGNSPLALALDDTGSLSGQFLGIGVSPQFGGMTYVDGANNGYSIAGGNIAEAKLMTVAAPQNVAVGEGGNYPAEQSDSSFLPGHSWYRISGTGGPATCLRMDEVYDANGGIQFRTYPATLLSAGGCPAATGSSRGFIIYGLNGTVAPGSTWTPGQVNSGTGSYQDLVQMFGGSPSPGGAAYADFAGTGSPAGVIVANTGSIYRDNSSGRLYFKVAGTQTSTGWVPLPVNRGIATLAAGTVTISDPDVTTTSIITLTNCGVSGAQGMLSIGTITAGTSFVINSSSATDTSKVCWSF